MLEQPRLLGVRMLLTQQDPSTQTPQVIAIITAKPHEPTDLSCLLKGSLHHPPQEDVHNPPYTTLPASRTGI